MGIFHFLLGTAAQTVAEVETDSSAESISEHVPTLLEPVVSFWAPLHEFMVMLGDWFMQQRFRLLVFFAGLVLSFLLAALISWIIRKIVQILAARTKSEIDNKLIDGLHAPIMLLLISSGVICSVAVLDMPQMLDDGLRRVYFATATLSIVWGVLRVIGVLDEHFKKIAASTSNNLDNLLIDLLRRVAKFAIWIIAALFIAQNIFKLNVSALLAGAGVAGLAVAFAAQNTVANIFGAITLILDKPFGIGDRVKLNDGTMGMVEAVGLRSTRLRSLDGSVWYVPNRQMADSSLENFAKRENLKYMFEIGLIYGTPAEKMRRAVELLHEILDNDPHFDMEELPPRIYFTDFKDWSLNITVIVWFQTQDWFEMQTMRHELNLTILERFNAEGLEFAFPTSTQYLTGDAQSPIVVKQLG